MHVLMSPPQAPPHSPLTYNTHTPAPLIFVTHLPSASSFYASILQPLGLQFLSSPPTPTPTPPVLNYGYLSESPAGLKKVVVFSITQSPYPGQAVRPSRITLSASSERSVREFYAKAGVLNKGLRSPNRLEFLSGVEGEEGEGIVAKTRDFDGNMLEAVYRARDRGHGGGRGMGGGIEMASSEREARRVLEWQEQVARSIGENGGSGGASVVSGGGSEVGYRSSSRPAPPALVRRADSYPVQGAERPLRLVRRETVTTEHYRRPEESQGGAGISGKAVIESPERERAPAPAPRRASYQGSHYTHVTQSPRAERAVERLPARSYASGREDRPRYVEYIATSTPAAPPAVARIEAKSYVSQRPGRSSQSQSSRARSRSEAGPRYERPLTILPAQSSRARSPVSHVSQRSSYKSAVESRKSSGSHVSYRSASTAKASPPPPATTTTRIQVVPSERERERRVMHSGLEREVDRRSSVVERARQVPLPMSVVSGMTPGYAASVAPSDSVSSVGTKRERERLRERMGIRDARGW